MEKLNEDIIELYKFIEENYKSHSDDIFYYLELLLDSIKNTKIALQDDIQKNSRNFSKTILLSGYGRKIENIENIVGDYLDSFSLNSSNNIEDIEEEDDEKRIIPNYKDYEVDQEIPHLLTESFTHKKICSFFLENIRYNVSDWKSALVKLCEILMNKDKDKFNSFVRLDLFSGNKRKYFAFNGKEKYYRRIGNTNIYVWTCHSANAICTIMRKLLREYNIPVNSMYIYLRADYTALHNDVPEVVKEPIIDDEIKIGKYVRESMRKLSNQHYKFSQDMLNKLTNDNATKKLFGIGTSFFREVRPGADISRLTKDAKGYNRYWKEVFRFNHKDYLIVSQWTKGNSDRFKNWLKSLPKA